MAGTGLPIAAEAMETDITATIGIGNAFIVLEIADGEIIVLLTPAETIGMETLAVELA